MISRLEFAVLKKKKILITDEKSTGKMKACRKENIVMIILFSS